MAALEFKLTRLRGDQFYTWGILEEMTGTGFKCRTCEEAKRRCLPEGEYPMKIFTDLVTLNYGLRLSVGGIWRFSRFAREMVGDMPGTIVLAGSFDESAKPINTERVFRGLSQIVETRICEGNLNKNCKRGEILLKIEKSPDFVFQEQEVQREDMDLDFT